jgi:transporter family protein
MNNWVFAASLSFVCWGVWAFIPKITTRYIDPMSAIVFETVGGIVMGFVVFALLAFRPQIHPRGIGLAMITGVLGMTGALGFLFAVRSGKVSVVAMFTAMSPVVTILLAHFFLKETITLKEGLGMLCAFAALVLFAI